MKSAKVTMILCPSMAGSKTKKWGLIMKPNLSFFVEENDSDPV